MNANNFKYLVGKNKDIRNKSDEEIKRLQNEEFINWLKINGLAHWVNLK